MEVEDVMSEIFSGQISTALVRLLFAQDSYKVARLSVPCTINNMKSGIVGNI